MLYRHHDSINPESQVFGFFFPKFQGVAAFTHDLGILVPGMSDYDV